VTDGVECLANGGTAANSGVFRSRDARISTFSTTGGRDGSSLVLCISTLAGFSLVRQCARAGSSAAVPAHDEFLDVSLRCQPILNFLSRHKASRLRPKIGGITNHVMTKTSGH
jgi:hypothetical protein